MDQVMYFAQPVCSSVELACLSSAVQRRSAGYVGTGWHLLLASVVGRLPTGVMSVLSSCAEGYSLIENKD